MKTDDSWRDIPLVGLALKVMRQHPEGLPRYRDKADSLSALVNKAFSARDLRPEPGAIICRTGAGGRRGQANRVRMHWVQSVWGGIGLDGWLRALALE
jgi:hypothetical protein